MKLNCLFTHAMKAKYYPKSDFMIARLGSHSSYTWRRIWSAQRLLEIGMVWRVGNDRSINIWNNVCLPSPRHERVAVRNIDINYTTVANLINMELPTWNLEALRKLFVK